MDQEGIDPDAAPVFPAKRRRGRPQKYPTLNNGENATVPPGFGGVNSDPPPHLVQPTVGPIDVMVGRAVSGVIEAAFDAGYLINVRVGDSETFLRGVVFKSGRYVPVTVDNDVAPGVEMIRRNEISLPKAQSSRERNHQHDTSHRNGTVYPFDQLQTINPVSTSLVVNKGKHVQSVAALAAHPSLERCDVPVVLQPLHFSNGAPIPNRPSPVVAADFASSKRKQVQLVVPGANPSNDRTSNLPPPVGDQVLTSQLHTTLQLMPQNLEVHGVHEAEANSPRQWSTPLGKGLAEVFKRIHGPSQSTQTDTESSNIAAGKMKVNDFGCILEDEVGNINQPLSVVPLQSVQPDQLQPSVSVHNRSGKMNEHLQVKKENQDEQNMHVPNRS